MRDAQGIPYRYQNDYSTAEEINFITGLATGSAGYRDVACTNGWLGRGANPDAFRNYARIVLTGMRHYDERIDVAAVKAVVRKMLLIAAGQVAA